MQIRHVPNKLSSVMPNSGSTNIALRLRNTGNFCKDEMLTTTTEMRMCNGREPARTKLAHIVIVMRRRMLECFERCENTKGTEDIRAFAEMTMEGKH